ncbi:MAG: sigma 54-interacting transcriptional regulator [Deltaproteobacteria bacterium]|jgi:transcriptional regulator with PAS, ATPase and Fis domain|nr:sigma 54-interacting transcriptional regulator [Deltaproteobacteria bacterium]
MLAEVDYIKRKAKFQNPDSDIIAHNQSMLELIEFAEQIAIVDSTVLIQGKSGTGKGVFAKFIHNQSRRKTAPFLAINCAAIPENLLESELFGYTAGTFTGAEKKGKTGLIELANGGTLFLDEIGELSPKLQAKFLHVIENKEFMPVGGRKIKKANVRIIAATNRNLAEMIKVNAFREDLFYRLNVIGLHIPPLCERPEDIPSLAYSFLRKFDQKYEASHEISQECLDVLVNYPWKGNVRELENLMERFSITIKESVINVHDLPLKFLGQNKINLKNPNSENTALAFLKEQLEKEVIIAAYQKLGSSRKVASSLKISQSSASRLIRKYCQT